MLRRSACIAAACLVSACSTPHYFLKSADISESSLVTDAKERAILTFPATVQGQGAQASTRRIVCAEPSPDVAQAISSAVQAGLQLDLSKAAGGTTGTKTAGFNFGQSSAASIAQLGERLAVVQLLRDKMYRACEAYANGAIREAAYTLLLARNDKSMMSLLSNELAAGAFGRALATAGGQSALSGIDPAALEEQQNKVKTAAGNLKTAATAETPKKADVEAAAKKLDEETAALLALERKVAVSATSTAQAISSLGSLTRTSDSPQVANIHQSYIDDDGVDPLVDACIIGVERLSKDDPDAKAYIRQIADRADKARFRVAELSNALEKERAELSGARAEEQRLLLRIASVKGSGVTNEKWSKLQEELIAIQTTIESHKSRVASLEADRERESKTQGLRAEDLYVASGSPFAAFCFQTVLGGDSKFMNLRMKQKRQLRGLEVSDDALSLKRLEVCSLALRAENGAIETAVRTRLLKICVQDSEESQQAARRAEICLAGLRADKGVLDAEAKKVVLANCAPAIDVQPGGMLIGAGTRPSSPKVAAKAK